MAEQYDVTSVGINPTKDRSHRMRMYFLTMTLRVLCVVSLFWVRGPWIILVGVGAVVLPYFAVLIANAVSHVGGDAPNAPTPLELTRNQPKVAEEGSPATGGASDAPVIVVDVLANRRSQSPEQDA